jgi:hypothetical protein
MIVAETIMVVVYIVAGAVLVGWVSWLISGSTSGVLRLVGALVS